MNSVVPVVLLFITFFLPQILLKSPRPAFAFSSLLSSLVLFRYGGIPLVKDLKGLLFIPLALASRISLLIRPEEGVVERLLEFTEGDLVMLFLLAR